MSKKNRLRECPAAGRPIEAFECATGRHMTYACPESCPFNVFATASYSKFREIEHLAEKKYFEWVIDHAADPAQFQADMNRLVGDGPSPAVFHRLAWHGVYRVGPGGDTCLGQYAKAGFPGLNTDERILMRGRMRLQPAMFEVHRVIDDQRVEVVDLLDPERGPFCIVDNGLAGQAVRFGVYGGHIAPLPHYTRILGTCTVIPNFHPLAPEEVIQEIIRHLGGPDDNPGRRAWLMEHHEEFDKALEAVSLARRRAMFEALDGQFGKAVYALAQPAAECIGQLATVPEIAEDPLTEAEEQEGFTEGRVWFAGAADKEQQQAGEGAVIGRVLLGPTHWRLEAMGGDRLARFRERFEQLMGQRLKFTGERLDDLGARLRMNEPDFDPALVPPTLLRETPRLTVMTSRVALAPGTVPDDRAAAGIVNDRQQGILDEPIPALENKTPRAAAADPALRPQLLRWMKFWISQTDQRNLETGRTDDTNWMVRELGLAEILFEPPPLRPRVLSAGDLEDDEEAGLPPFLALPDPPALPDRPWTAKEAGELMHQAVKAFPPSADVGAYFSELQYPLFPDLNDLLGEDLQEAEITCLFQVVSWVVLCFAPRGTCPPEVLPDELEDSLRRAVACVSDCTSAAPGSAFTGWIEGTRQPELLANALAVTLTWIEKAPSGIYVRASAKPVLIAALGAVVDALDEAARAES
jgi:hypothetical protein